MVRSGSRASATLMLEAAALSRALDDTSEEDESEDEWGDPEFLSLVARSRILYLSNVLKVSSWDPQRIYRMDPERARRELRISIAAFRFVLDVVKTNEVFNRVPRKQEQAPVQLQVEHFGIGEGTVRKFCDRVILAILTFEDQYIRWPSRREKHDPKRFVENLNGFKNTHLYYQLGLPGSVHDKRALSFSAMSNLPPAFFDFGEYLLGDSEYGVSFPFIVSPYKRPASTIRENAQFNRLLSKARIIIEHCIGVVKSRFPCLSLYGIHLAEKGAAMRLLKTQRACFVLHNTCIELSEADFEVEDESSDSDSDSEADSDDDMQLGFDPDEHLSSEELRLIVQNDVIMQI
ncbi:hypothetical protein Ae201684P_009016 [Aphanomyces euteiches]|nr:hypothetical protein Ae201684P_009016 [Aphanomyces euteiches]